MSWDRELLEKLYVQGNTTWTCMLTFLFHAGQTHSTVSSAVLYVCFNCSVLTAVGILQNAGSRD